MKEVVIVGGLRTPFIKAWTLFNFIPAQELGRVVVSELLQRLELDPAQVDEVIFGNIVTPAEAANIARVIALMGGLPAHVPAYTISRNCASGVESIAHAYYMIQRGEAEIVIAGGVESMSNIPLIYQKETAEIFTALSRAKSLKQRLQAFLKSRPRHFFRPVIGLQQGLTDGYCGLNMGETAEVLAREWVITRQQQDKFAFTSHQRAAAAAEAGKLREEIVPVYVSPDYEAVLDDNGIRKGQSLEALAELKPVFDSCHGTVTAGNASQITDGAAAVVVMSAEKARALGYESLGSIRTYAYAALKPTRMGLGPALAIPKALEKAKLQFTDIQLWEINEAFAAQVLAVEKALNSKRFAQEYLGRDEVVGEIDNEMLNVNGGAIALGHPVGASATRLVITLLREMQRRNLQLGLVSMCVGGGQGAAMILERQ
ncbi:thiolase family protein [bacterium]|nr:thiolase family protein [bacterium]